MSLVLRDFVQPGILRITLNDPENLNAMSESMAQEFLAITSEIIASKVLPRAVFLTGSGRAFSAGGDLSMLEGKHLLSPEKNRALMLEFYNSFLSILKIPVPIIAAINGAAIGAGLCLASACDIRISSEGAKLGFTFTRLGLHPGMGATYFLPRILGTAIAKELLLTARIIEAEEALRLGLVSKIVRKEELESSTLAICKEISVLGPESVSALVKSLRGEINTLSGCLEHEANCQSISYASQEFKEGVRAAIEKRAARFAV